MAHQSIERVITLGLSALLLFGCVLGCKQLARKGSRSYTNGREGSNSGKPASGILAKNNLYIKECVNKYSNSVIDSYHRYTSWIKDVDNGPTGKESIVYGLYDISGDGQDCVDAIAKAKAMDPSLPAVEAAADNYGKALKDAVAEIKAIYPYYNHEDYKDDNFQKGKEVHPTLLRAFRAFEQANKSFDGEVGKLEDQVAEKQLADLKDDSSKRYDYLVVDTGIKSKKIMKLVKENVHQADYSALRVEDLQPLIDDLERSVDELKTVGKTRTMGTFYASACDDFVKAAKDMMRRVRDKKPYSEFERQELGTGGGWMVDGSPDQLIRKYNDMISRRGM